MYESTSHTFKFKFMKVLRTFFFTNIKNYFLTIKNVKNSRNLIINKKYTEG
jgi:hypothetical protein